MEVRSSAAHYSIYIYVFLYARGKKILKWPYFLCNIGSEQRNIRFRSLFFFARTQLELCFDVISILPFVAFAKARAHATIRKIPAKVFEQIDNTYLLLHTLSGQISVLLTRRPQRNAKTYITRLRSFDGDISST